MLRLIGGESVVLGSFPTREVAAAKARELVAYLTALGSHEWPVVGDHFLRPDSITSLELVSVATPGWPASGTAETGAPEAAQERALRDRR